METARSTALMTDMYELTMVRAALADGTADKPSVFEVFARRLPAGRRYGVVAGTGRMLAALERFRFGDEELAVVADLVDARTADWLADYRFRGEIDGYREGELYFPGSPVLTVRGGFAECVLLETLVLSIYNHDSAIASAAARMASAAGARPMIEMGSRRTHEEAAVAAARAAYLAGFTATSNLEAARRYGVPPTGTSAHAFTLLYTTAAGPDEAGAFRAQVAALGTGTTLLVDTYDTTAGVTTAAGVAGDGLGAVRIDSGDLGVMAEMVRAQLDALGNRETGIVVSGDLDEYALAALAAAPVDAYGVGTSLVTGSGAPTAGMVYKLVEVDGVPVAKRATDKASRGGAKAAVRWHRPTGTAVAEVVHPAGAPAPAAPEGLNATRVTVPLVRGGAAVGDADPAGALAAARDRVAARLRSLPWEGLRLTAGDAALPVQFVDP